MKNGAKGASKKAKTEFDDKKLRSWSKSRKGWVPESPGRAPKAARTRNSDPKTWPDNSRSTYRPTFARILERAASSIASKAISPIAIPIRA